MKHLMFEGEEEAIATVKALGAQYGYGNLISRLHDAWSEHMQRTQGFDKVSGDLAGGHICVWCLVDKRTGKKVKLPKHPVKRKTALREARARAGQTRAAEVETLLQLSQVMKSVRQARAEQKAARMAGDREARREARRAARRAVLDARYCAARQARDISGAD